MKNRNKYTRKKFKDVLTKRILIIEDDPTYLKMMRLRLEKVGYQILTAPDGFMGFTTWSEKNEISFYPI